MKASYFKYLLDFKKPAGTSRGILLQKETFFLIVEDNNVKGIGECSVFRGLSADDVPEYEEKLQWICQNISLGKEIILKSLSTFPSLYFGVEQAFLTLENKNSFLHFPSKFTDGQEVIPINGLIWMGNSDDMKKQVKDKIESGFSTIKLKIGALDFETEWNLLKSIRKEYSTDKITIRVDANGGFHYKDALEKLKKLSEFDLHSIEQPIKAGQWENMADLCEKSPIHIALDEELIGVFEFERKKELLQAINPHYIILKPSLHGGIKGSNEWIKLAEKQNTGWWITSALESNIGLNAIAQYTYSLGINIPQGLGTGGLYTNNFESPLEVVNGNLRYDTAKKWEFNTNNLQQKHK